ncbi:MAG: DUF2141 domain-containing protein [Oceanobacter sp.]
MKQWIAGCLLGVGLLGSLPVWAGDLEVTVDKLRNQQGNLVVMLFSNAADFKAGKYQDADAMVVLKAKQQRRFMLSDLEPGRYAISVLHDEDKNERLNTNKRGFPLEGYAYSNQAGLYEVPEFEQAVFEHKKGADSVIHIDMTYIK